MKKTIAVFLTLALLWATFATAIANELEGADSTAVIDEIPIELADASGEAPELMIEDWDDSVSDLPVYDGLAVDEDALMLPEALGQTDGVLQDSAPEDFLIDAKGVLTKYTGRGGDVMIPRGVTGIGYWAFRRCENLTGVYIPDSVTSIGEEAFSLCKNLSSVIIPETLTSIGPGAFTGCARLSGIEIPNGVPRIEARTFSGCASLMSVSVPNSVTSIGDRAFCDCASLSNLTIPKNVTSIGWYAFSGCASLMSITIPKKVTSIGWYAFSGCRSLTSVSIPTSVTGIGEEAFYGCESLTGISIPESVTGIGNGAFSGCTSLTEVSFPESVTSIGKNAFSGCTGLVRANIPKSVSDIGTGAFDGCPNLTIYGKAGSHAETYARKNNIPFVSDSPSGTDVHFPILIGNINESNPKKYASFDKLLEDYTQGRDSGKYYKDLAHMLMALSAAAYNKPSTNNSKLTIKKDGYAPGVKASSRRLYYISKAFSDLGFTDYKAYNYYGNPNAPKYGSHNAAFTIGQKKLSNDEALVLIVVRGSFGKDGDYTSSDWVSNLNVDVSSKGRHYGFDKAAAKVYDQAMKFLRNYYKDAFIKNNIRYVITGHSRGAAVANLLAVRLHDAGVPNSKVFDYNFACPDTVQGLKTSDLSKGHENIWNISNTADAVAIIPGVVGDDAGSIVDKYQGLFAGWGKYGHTGFYCNNWNKAAEFNLNRTFTKDSPHDFAKYVRDLSKRSSKRYSWANVAARRKKLGVDNGVSRIVETLYPKYTGVSLNSATITVEDQVYTGKKLTPEITVKYKKETLKKDADYTVAYKNNQNIGAATVIVKGKGKYAGRRTVHFNINPRAVTGLSLKAGSRKITASWDKVDGVSGYQLQYDQSEKFASAKKVTVTDGSSNKKALQNLEKDKTYYVRIRCYKSVNNKTYYSAWSEAKKVKTD